MDQELESYLISLKEELSFNQFHLADIHQAYAQFILSRLVELSDIKLKEEFEVHFMDLAGQSPLAETGIYLYSAAFSIQA